MPDSKNERVFIDIARTAGLTPEAKSRVLSQTGSILAEKARANARAKGGKSFWGRIADSVLHKVDGQSVVVGSSDHIGAFKHDGGPISAPGKGVGAKKPARKYLSIPLKACPKTKRDTGAWAKGILKLVTMRGKTFLGRMVKAGGTISRGKNKGQPRKKFEALFILKKSVTHKAAPWWPSTTDAEAAIAKAVKRVSRAA